MTSSMEVDLQEMDLSLFGGELLVGLPPTTDELKVTEDVEKSAFVTSSWETNLNVLQGHDELNNQVLITSGLDDTSWLDSRVDLLDLLSQEGEFALAEGKVALSDNTAVVTEDELSLNVLQSLAEETTEMLNNGHQDLISDISLAQNVDNSVQEEPADCHSVDNLLDILSTGGMDTTTVDTDNTLNGIIFGSTILSPVTAEDLESILSSEISSPLPPKKSLPKTKSLLAQYLVGELDTGACYKQATPSGDFSDQQELINENHDDPDYEPCKVSRSHSKREAKSTSSRTKGRISKQHRTIERKLRKKQQNKDAATRYRIKKRTEQEIIDQECKELESHNTDLRDKVDQMTNEIGYLKNLLVEVYKARGLIPPKTSKSEKKMSKTN